MICSQRFIDLKQPHTQYSHRLYCVTPLSSRHAFADNVFKTKLAATLVTR